MEENDEPEVSEEIIDILNKLLIPEYCRKEIAYYLHPVDKKFIHRYIQNTAGPTHPFKINVLSMFKVERPGCKLNFKHDYEKRMLLWHGTCSNNVYKIIRDGFDLKKANKISTFGPGIYFTDCVTKAANYSEQIEKKYGYLFLCEVALGKVKTLKHSNYDANEELDDSNSVLGQGRYTTTDENDQFCYETLICPGPLKINKNVGIGHSIDYNEFIVYSTEQIQLRYLVRFQFEILRDWKSPKLT